LGIVLKKAVEYRVQRIAYIVKFWWWHRVCLLLRLLLIDKRIGCLLVKLLSILLYGLLHEFLCRFLYGQLNRSLINKLIWCLLFMDISFITHVFNLRLIFLFSKFLSFFFHLPDIFNFFLLPFISLSRILIDYVSYSMFNKTLTRF